MKEVNSGRSNSSTPTDHGTIAIPDHDPDAIAGGGISGQKEAARLLDEHLASLGALSFRTDLSQPQKEAMKASYGALFPKTTERGGHVFSSLLTIRAQFRASNRGKDIDRTSSHVSASVQA